MHDQPGPSTTVESDGSSAKPEAASTLHVLEGPAAGVEPALDEEIAQPVDLGRRFTDWRTAVSFAIGFAILALALWKSGIDRDSLGTQLHKVNPWLFAAAFVVYYSSFPVRTLRWKLLMLNANVGAERERVAQIPFRDLLEILYLSWFANCVIPAKIGDVYRAYLAKTWAGVSASRTVGTIVAERILDLLILFPLLLTAAILTFHDKLLDDSAMRFVLGGALALGIVGLALIFAIWQLGEGVRRLLPLRIHAVFTAFREGAIHSFSARLGTLLALSIVVWICEGGRLFLVLASLGVIKQGEIGPSAALFLALGSSVITTLPVAPGGLGFVDTFLIKTFTILKPGAQGAAGALTILDRLISYLSIVVIGFVVYLVSKKTKIRSSAQGGMQPGTGGPAVSRQERTSSLP